jgi:hypothetical protein
MSDNRRQGIHPMDVEAQPHPRTPLVLHQHVTIKYVNVVLKSSLRMLDLVNMLVWIG